MDVTIAARPTREWNAATVWGSLMGSTLKPTYKPATAPGRMQKSRQVCITDWFISTNVEIIADATAEIPIVQPAFAVFIEDKAPMAMMHIKPQSVWIALMSLETTKVKVMKRMPGKTHMKE